MPIKTTNLSYEKFYNKFLSLLILVEDKRQYVYTDSVNVVTIGIGVNIEEEKWRNVILMYKVSILEYTDLEVGVYTLANILGKQLQSVQTLINKTSAEIKKKIIEYKNKKNLKANNSQEKIKNNVETIQNLQEDINTILQNNIKIYNQNPENINQKLNENMVFELTDNEAKEVKKIISFEKMYNLRKKLQKWNANYLTSFSKTELTNPQEFIPLLSIYYQRPARFNPESGLILLQKALKDKNRFLAWFSMRYYADIQQFKNPFYIRRIQEAAMFSLSNKNQNNIEYFSTSLDIFSYLNFYFKEANTKEGLRLPDAYTYLSFIQNYGACKKVDKEAKKLLNEYNIYHSKNKHYYSYVAKEEFQDITSILSPYLNYLNTLTQKNFSLENIYCIANYCKNLGANKIDNIALLNKTLSKRFKNQETNTLCNILILYPNPTASIIQIEQPKNTFITLLVGVKAKIDCSKLIEDQCELMYLKYDPTQEEQQISNPQAFSCSTQEELLLKKENETHFKAIKNNILYSINKNDGILKVAFANDKENAIGLYSFAKENQFKILKDKASKMLKIHLKLEEYEEEILSHRGGNFELTLNNLNILDENGNNHKTITKVFLHNCENRRIYESLELSYKEGIYKSSFKIDLILEENSSFFKRATKCIIATKALGDFSTSQIHKMGNVAIVSLSAADKQRGYYTFENKVSMQDFGKNLYLDAKVHRLN